MQVHLYPRIVADTAVLAGKPVIQGTHVPASSIVASVATGKGIAQVAQDFGVGEEDVRAALEYAAQCVGEEVALDDPFLRSPASSRAMTRAG